MIISNHLRIIVIYFIIDFDFIGFVEIIKILTRKIEIVGLIKNFINFKNFENYSGWKIILAENYFIEIEAIINLIIKLYFSNQNLRKMHENKDQELSKILVTLFLMNLISICFLKMNQNLVKVQKVVHVDYQNYMISSYQLFVINLGIDCSKVGKHF